jgi:hypothetical protein
MKLSSLWPPVSTHHMEVELSWAFGDSGRTRKNNEWPHSRWTGLGCHVMSSGCCLKERE